MTHRENWNLLKGASKLEEDQQLSSTASQQTKKIKKKQLQGHSKQRSSAADQNEKQVTAGWLDHV